MGGQMKRRVRGSRSRMGVVALEYILTCALLVLGAAMAMPFAMRLVGRAFSVIAEVIGSPFPAGM